MVWLLLKVRGREDRRVVKKLSRHCGRRRLECARRSVLPWELCWGARSEWCIAHRDSARHRWSGSWSTFTTQSQVSLAGSLPGRRVGDVGEGGLEPNAVQPGDLWEEKRKSPAAKTKRYSRLSTKE